MADGFDIHLDEERARKVRAAAKASGVSMAEFVDGAVDVMVDARWAEHRRRLAEYHRTGEAMDLDDALALFDRELKARLAARG